MATTSSLRQTNERKIVHRLMRLRTASRIELSQQLSLSQPTVSRIVDRLLADGILVEVDASVRDADRPARVTGPGRPSTSLRFNPDGPRFGVVQVGVRSTRLAVVPIAFDATDEWPVRFETPATAVEWQSALARAWAGFMPPDIVAAAVSLPGVVDDDTGNVVFSPNLRWAERADFAAMVRSVSPAPVVTLQEIRALALGQLFAEPGCGDFLLVDFATGVGAAAVIGRQLYRAPLPLAGEIGHTPVPGNTRKCACGSHGCLETLVSRAGLIASAREQGVRGGWPGVLESLNGDVLPEWARLSFEAAAMNIAGAMNVLGLRHVVVTGLVGESPSLNAFLCDAVRRGMMWAKFGEVTCRTVPRRRAAGLLSAAINRVLLGEKPVAARPAALDEAVADS